MTTRYQWNDDDRKNDYISYYDRKEEEYVPVYKILKEMYDEDKANLYIYDTEEEYQHRYGPFYFNRYCEYFNEYYSKFNETYQSSHVDSDEDDISEDVQIENIVEENKNDTEKKERFDMNDDVEEEQVECIDETKSKFIYT